MSKNKWILLSVILDAIMINITIVLAFLIRFSGKLPPFNFEAYTSLAIFITLIQLGTLYIYDLYTPEKTQSSWDIFFSIIKAVTLGVILIVALTFFYRFFSFPRTVFALSWFLLVLTLSSWRIVTAKILKVKYPSQRVLIIGTEECSKDIITELKKRAQWGYELVGVVSRETEVTAEKFEGIPVVGNIYKIPNIVKDYKVNRVIITTPIRQKELVEELAKFNEAEIRVEIVPELYEIFIGKVDHTLISDIPLMELTKESVPSWVYLSKRLFDLLLSLVLIALTLPLTILVALLIKLTSKGSVFYKQERVGKRGRIFNLYKFRTMIAGAEEETGPVLAKVDDARVTRFGGFLRRYRIDELPQLFNILKGDMSFVGPRPERQFFVDLYTKEIPGYKERFRAKPGISGLAQVSGHYATTPQNKLKYDLIYIYHQSILLDIEIILRTLKVVLTGKGAR